MKKKIFKIVSVFILLLSVGACKTEFENHNSFSEEAVYQTPEAYPGIVLGMTNHFARYSLYEIVRGPGVVSREIGATNTYTTENELESGSVPDDNASISALWRNLMYERGIAEKILTYINDVTFPDDAEKNGIKAYAHFFKGMTNMYLGMYWEKAPVDNNPDNAAAFASRNEVLQSAIDHFDEALNILNGSAGSDAYINSLVSNTFSIVDVINAFKARVYLEMGDWQHAISAANNVDLTSTSVWTYDGSTTGRNPVWLVQYDANASERWKAIKDMGITLEAGDQRYAFYVDDAQVGPNTETCNYDTRFITGFWTSSSSPIPVYLPDEVKLMKAEAYAQMGGGNLANAVALIDEVRQDTNDPFGVNAGLGPWTGNAADQQEVLDQIFYNYATECFLQGVRWNAHKRIYPDYLNGVQAPVDCAKERSRNYFPYPSTEKANNPNTPADPAI